MIRLFRVYLPVGVLALLLSELVLTILCFLFAASIVLTEDVSTYLLYENGLIRFIIVIASIILGLHLLDLYTRIHVTSRMRLLQDLCQVFGIALLAQGLISYAQPSLRFGRGIMLLGCLLSLVVLFIWRLIYSAYILKSVGNEHLLFVGSSPIVQEIANHINAHPELGISIDGYVEDLKDSVAGMVGARILGPIADLRKVAQQVKPSRIVVGISEWRELMPAEDLLDLRFAGFTIQDAASTYEAVCGRIRTQELRPSQLIFSSELGPQPANLLLQDAINLAVAIVGTIVTLPIMVLVGIAVKLTSPGPVFYRQVRIGKNGRPFVINKFRSMQQDAENSTGAVWASKDDPRLTSIGGWLRRLRLDELPQFFNVLRGEMSLVGPRPERPEFVETLAKQIPYYRQRHCVKPGITGWAQINHKYGDTLEDAIVKLEYDLYYIKNISPSLDAYIVFHTLKTIILARGAQ
ncbi:MAG TPA: sugar transferase [Bryobacteraceae bacterium]|nr:sugar transferase [Bryobacteraceae bacterium]